METTNKRHSETLKLNLLLGSKTIIGETLKQKDNRPKMYFTKAQLWNLFKIQFEKLFNKKFKETEDSIANISALFYYFLRDERFMTHSNVRSDLSVPSFNKGLLLIGGYGIGKTANMKVLEQCFRQFGPFRFKIFSTNEVVQKYENCETANDKKAFFNSMNLGTNLYDDLTTERLASNYGHVDIIKDILEERYMLNKLTHATANYKEGSEKTAEAALMYLGERYGSRLYDRLFEMFNIVVFEGKSFRR